MREREGERRKVEGGIEKGRRSGGDGREGEGRGCEEVLKEEMRAGSEIHMPIA